MLKSKNKYIVFVDVETTGFPEQAGYIGNDLLSWSGIVTDTHLNILDKATFFSRPQCEKYWGAEHIHGFSYKEAMRFPMPRSCCVNILKFLAPYKHEDNWPLLWVEHSLNWIDYLFTCGLFMRQDLLMTFHKVVRHDHALSTIKMARALGYKQNKLNEWADRLNIKLEHHNSESDVMACYEVYKFLLNHGELNDGTVQSSDSGAFFTN